MWQSDSLVRSWIAQVKSKSKRPLVHGARVKVQRFANVSRDLAEVWMKMVVAENLKAGVEVTSDIWPSRYDRQV